MSNALVTNEYEAGVFSGEDAAEYLLQENLELQSECKLLKAKNLRLVTLSFACIAAAITCIAVSFGGAS